MINELRQPPFPDLLPSPYPAHKHATADAREVAHHGLIFLAEVGSGVHGIAVPGTDDRDLMGIALEPPDHVTGLRTFEQFHRHTAWDRPGGLANRSGHGDTDVVVYSARKFCRLALAGNPSILTLLFVPDDAVVTSVEPPALELRDNAHRFVSRQAADRYLGYLHRQRLGMTGEAGAKVKRRELVAEHGYDTKFAAHAVRLGKQGVELLITGRITLPMSQQDRDEIIPIRRGEVPLAHVIRWIEGYERLLIAARDRAVVPEHPDAEWVDRWLHRAHLDYWARLR